MKRSKVISQLLIIAGIFIVLNMISNNIFFRADFTADKRYTLSKATKDILNELEDVVTVKAYFTKDLPPQLLKSRTDFEDLLLEYENRSDGNVLYEFLNPNESQEDETEAQQKGISPIMVNVTKKDQVQQMRAYMGAVLQIGEKTEVIPVIQPGSGMEYALTTAIKKISLVDKPKVAFLQGHGEPSMNASMQLLEQLSVLYDVEPLTITDTSDVPAYYRTVAIIDPKDTFPASHLAKLDIYLNSGGSVYLAYSNLQSDLNAQYLNANPDIGLKGWLADKGITLNDQYVIDAACGAVTVRQQQGPFMINSQVQFPYFPIISQFSEHPVGEGIESLFMPFVSSLSYLPADSSVIIEPIAFSSEMSGVRSVPVYIDINHEWTERDFNAPRQVIALAASGPIAGTGNSKMVVIANGAYAVNGEGQQQQQVNPDNVNFSSNSIDWLSDDTGLINLRTKGITSRPLEQIDDSKKLMYKIGNLALPILLVLILALVRWQRSVRKRQKWMQGIY